MQDPKRLKVRSEARRLAAATYRLTTGFPAHERFGLASQMRRAAVSIGSNISEGCGTQGDRAMIPHLHHAVGSFNELEFQLEVATELGYVDHEHSIALTSQSITARRMLIRLTMALRKRSLQRQ